MKLNVTKYFEQTTVITVYRLHDRLVDKSLLFIYIHVKSGSSHFYSSLFFIYSKSFCVTCSHSLPVVSSAETQTETRLSIKQTFMYHCSHTLQAESALCCGDSHLILDNILVNISASPVTSLCVSLAAQAYYCKAKASLQTCTRCANNATWHCCSYSWRTEKKTPHWFVTQWPVVRSKPKGTHVLWIRAQIYLGNLHEQTSIAKVFASPALVL